MRYIAYTSRFVRVILVRRGHAKLLCIVPNLMDDPRRESCPVMRYIAGSANSLSRCAYLRHIAATNMKPDFAKHGRLKRIFETYVSFMLYVLLMLLHARLFCD